jgi:predicted phage tail protein
MGFFKNFVKALSDPTNIVLAAATFLVPGAAPFTLKAFATRVAIQAALTATVATLTPKPKLPSFSDFSSQSQNRTQLIKQPTVPRRIIYGETRVSGVLGFIETTDNNKFLNLVILLATHEVNQIGTIFINDEALTLDGSGNATAPSKYSGKVRVKKHLGTDGQSADTDLIASSNSKWTSNHKLSGIAYIYVRLEFDADAFPNGLPNISALVQGKKVFDPRTSTTAYSTNPALCIRDYLTDSKYGFGASSSEIDDTSFTTAANICEESVSLNAGGTENKYTLNGTFESNTTPKQTLENLLTSMGGLVTYSNGKFKVKAAKYVTPTVTLDENDVRGAIGVQTNRSRRDNFNGVKGVFVSPTNNYIAADYPAFTSSTFQTEDGGDRVFLDLDLPYTTSSSMAQRLSKIALFRNRQKISMTMNCSLKAFQLDVGDVVNINNTRFGFSTKTFEVAEWGLSINSDENNTNLTVDLTLREINSAVYDWTPGTDEKVFQQDNTTLPDPFTVQPPASVTLSDQLIEYNDGTVIVALDIAIGASTEGFVSFYQVEYKLSTDSDFIIYAQGSGLNHRVLNVIDQSTYDVRVKAVNSLGVSSSYVSAQRQIVGAIAPPSDVIDFSANVSGQEAHLSWEAVTDLDLAYYNLRFSEATDGSADWLNSVALVEKISRPATSISVPARQGTYLIKAVDKLGNFSSNATAIISNVTSPLNFNAVTTQSEHPTFGGTFTNTVLTDGAIELDSSELFDSASGNFDDETTRFFDSGVANADFQASGNYEFADVIDIGAKHTVRITASLTQTADNPDDLFDNRTGDFDDASSNFDGDTPANCNAHLEIATSDDNSTYTDFRGFVIGEYEARYFKFRVVLISRDLASTPVVSAVTVTLDMQDRIFSGNDIVSGTGTKSITFTNPFKSGNFAVGITGQGMATGDYFTVSNKTINGFDVAFFNSSDIGVSKTFDFIAKGF